MNPRSLLTKSVNKYLTEHDSFLEKFHKECESIKPEIFESPLNESFYYAFMFLRGIYEVFPKKHLIGIQNEYQIPYCDERYRVDAFVYARKYGEDNDCAKCFVEFDGFSYHDRTVEQFNYERRRQNYITSLGGRLFRYTHKDITENVFQCAMDVIDELSTQIMRIEYAEYQIKGGV